MTPKQAWPQASHQLNPALLTRMLIPVQLYIFINHIGTVFRIWYPLPNRTVDFFYLCSPPRRQWLIVHENDCVTVHYEDHKLWGPVFSCYNLIFFFRCNSQFFGQMISSPPPLEKMARTPMVITGVCYNIIVGGLRISLYWNYITSGSHQLGNMCFTGIFCPLKLVARIDNSWQNKMFITHSHGSARVL